MPVRDLVLLSTAVRSPDPALLAAGVAVCAVAELARRERLQVGPDGRVRLLEGPPTGDPVLDDLLPRLERMGPRPVGDVCDVVGRVVLHQAEEDLARSGVLHLEEPSFLGVRGRSTRVVRDRARLTTVRQRLVDVLTGETAPTSDARVLLTALEALGWLAEALAPAAPGGWSRRDMASAAAQVPPVPWVATVLRDRRAARDGSAAAIGGA